MAVKQRKQRKPASKAQIRQADRRARNGRYGLQSVAVEIVVSSVIAVAGLGIALLASISARRRVNQANLRSVRAADELAERTQSTLANLEGALSEAQLEALRMRALGDLSTSLELDEIIARVLDAATGLSGVDAALATVPLADEAPLVRSVGLTEDEHEGQAAGLQQRTALRAGRVSYHYAEEEASGSPSIYGEVTVPVTAGADGHGSLTIFTRSASHRFGEREVRDLEEIANLAGPAVVNALRFREVRALADIDGLTHLYNRRVFHETLAREVARARRYDRQLTLVIFDVDDFKAVNERLGHLEGDGVLAEVAERVRGAVRSTDVACRVGGDEFAVVMPESTLDDGIKLSQRLQAAVSGQGVVHIRRVGISAGVAELREGDDGRSLFERADQALYQAKGEGKGRVVGGSKSDLGSA
jgi:diguanylate cyclase (GGDEF)-like protein